MPLDAQKIALEMQRLAILEEDITEKFILGSGKGGQKLHKTSSCVYLKHLPSGIEVKMQKSRLREENRLLARRLLCEKLSTQVLQIHTKKQQEIHKIRKQKQRRSRKHKEKILQDKKAHGLKKSERAAPRYADEKNSYKDA